MELKLTPSSLPTTIFKSSSFFSTHFSLLAQRWKLHIQRISWEGQDIRKKILVHVVKGGETLTSISRLYGVPILEIAAANKELVVDVDLVSEGKHLNIPSTVVGHAQGNHLGEGKLHENRLSKALGFHPRQWNQIFSVPPSLHLPSAKATGSFLVLVPLIAFCIRCIMGAFQNRVVAKLRNQAANKPIVRGGSKSMRWRNVLSELRDEEDTQTEDVESSQLSEMKYVHICPVLQQHLSEDKEHLHAEDMSVAYSKLEDDYQKFLSECGMSNWGHWRGGSPE